MRDKNLNNEPSHKTNKNNSPSSKQKSNHLNSSINCAPAKKKRKISLKNNLNLDNSAENVNITPNKLKQKSVNLDKKKLIKDLVKKQKKIIFSNEHDKLNSYSAEEDSKFNWRELGVQNKVISIEKLRKLPNYEEIDEILNAPKRSIHTKLKDTSLNSITWHKTETREHWSTYTYLSEKIEQCVLHRKWDYLTKLLKLFTDSPKWYKPFLLRSTIINLICNSISKDDESVLEEFLKSGFSCRSEDDMRQTLTSIFHISAVTKEEPID